MVSSWTEDSGVGRFSNGTKKTGLERLHYRRVFCANEMKDFPVFKELNLTARKMLRWKGVSAKGTQYDAEHGHW